MAYNIHTLANGIKVVHIPSSGIVGYCGLLINAGTRDEADNEHGIAHFIEHVIFKGTRKRRAYHILNRLDEVGGELNAYTTKEETTVHAAFLSHDFDRAAELIADMVFNSTFPERELAKEKEVIADEITSYLDNPAERILDEFEERIFAGSSMGHNILGTTESLATFDGDAVRRFMNRCYNTDQMVFSVLGNMPWQKVVRVAEKYFGCVPSNPRNSNRHAVGVPAISTVRTNLDTHQGHIAIGCIAPGSFDNDRLPMFILSNVLGGPCMNSRLSLLLREKNGIGYNVETSYTPFSDTGLFTIYYGTDVDNIDRSLRIVHKELDRLRNAAFSEAQMKRIKRQFVGQLLMSSDNGENQMLSIGKSVLLYGVADDTATVCRRIEEVGAPEVRQVADQYLSTDKLASLIYY